MIRAAGDIKLGDKMKNTNGVIRPLLLFALGISIVAPSRSFAKDTDGSNNAGAVFAMTNSVDKNEIIAFRRNDDGGLQQTRTFETDGRGSGGNVDPLGSQGSLVLSQDRSYLFAVNAGSGELSVFRVQGDLLSLEDKVISGGSEPVAVTQHADLVYVVNAGGNGNVVGFRWHHGELTEIPNSTRFLSGSNSAPGSIAFSPDGKFVAVTEKQTSKLDVFSVQTDGTLSPAVVTPSAGPGEFAISFALNGTALVSETGPAGGVDASALSSYALLASGSLTPITTSVPTLGAATCWQVATPDGRFVYTSNAGTATISGFSINANGSLAPLPGTVQGSNPSGATNIDVTISSDGKFLYTLNAGNGTIGIFAIHKDGTLTNLGSADGLTAAGGFNGIAAN
jgi:6-phosphogluconolactonase (cycloisomerase 2 family)